MWSDDEVKTVLTVFHNVRDDFSRNIRNINDFVNNVFWSMFRKENDKFLLGATLCK